MSNASPYDVIGGSVLRMHRTFAIDTGVRSVLALPGGATVHVLEDWPIAPGVYFMRPDFTGRHRHWVVEHRIGTREAMPSIVNDSGIELEPARHAIEWHGGNHLGASDGCMLPGMSTDVRGVVDSQGALALMRDVLRRDVPDPPVHVLHIIGRHRDG